VNDDQTRLLPPEGSIFFTQLQAASAKVDQALALVKKAGTALKPSINLAGGYADKN